MRFAVQSVLSSAALAAALFLCGCQTTPWVRGTVADGRPKLSRKFPLDVAFFVDRTERRVKAAFEEALRARGFTVVDKEEACDVVVRAKVLSWEVNDAGFAGFGPRDDMELSISLVDRRHRRILARANVSVRSDFRIISKYVETL